MDPPAFDRRLAHYARVERKLYELQTEHEQLQLSCGIKQSEIEIMQSQIEIMQSQTEALKDQLKVMQSRATALCVFICACAALKLVLG